MRSFIYIDCRELDGVVSFAHCFVQAVDKAAAARFGAEVMRRPSMKGSSHGHFTGRFLNDYVIEIPEKHQYSRYPALTWDGINCAICGVSESDHLH